MTRDQAIADLAAATGSEVLGRTLIIDGAVIDAVLRSLTIEEAMAFSGGQYADDGLSVEGLRLTVDVNVLGYEPVQGAEMVVDGSTYTVRLISKIGNNRRITLTRYLA